MSVYHVTLTCDFRNTVHFIQSVFSSIQHIYYKGVIHLDTPVFGLITKILITHPPFPLPDDWPMLHMKTRPIFQTPGLSPPRMCCNTYITYCGFAPEILTINIRLIVFTYIRFVIVKSFYMSLLLSRGTTGETLGLYGLRPGWKVYTPTI